MPRNAEYPPLSPKDRKTAKEQLNKKLNKVYENFMTEQAEKATQPQAMHPRIVKDSNISTNT